MNYRHVYMLIIEHAKSEEELGLRKRGNGEYYEKHHILPKSLFPLWAKRKSNLVLLTAREHFFCHQLLTKIYPTPQMFKALSVFCKFKQEQRKLTSRQYEICRKAAHEANLSWWKNTDKKESIINTVNNARIEKIKYLKENGLYEDYINQIKQKKTATRIKNWEVKTDEEKEKIRAKRSEAARLSQLNGGSEKRLKTIMNNGGFEEINKKIKETKSKFSKEKIQDIKEKISKSSKKYWASLSEEEKEKISENRSLVISKQNIGRHWFNNGYINKFCYECPEGFVPGQLKGEKKK